MTPSDDHDLLRQYTQDGSQAAFAELVRRHLNLVYSVALRQVRSTHLAEEVAQSVFADLARQTARLDSTQPLVAWLHVVSRRAAIDVVRRESRRQAREAACPELVEWAESAMKPTPSVWADVEPLLDEAVETLGANDRNAILLRFFENKSLREIGATLGVSEDTAQKRVSRAVDQLRTFFLRRGVTVTAAGLVTDLSAHVIHVAPPALGTAISSSAALSGTVLGSVAAETTRTLAMTTLQKTLLAAAVAIIGSGFYEISTIRRGRQELQAAREGTALVLAKLRQLQNEQAAVERQIDDASRTLATRIARTAGSDAPPEPEMQAWLARVKQLKQLATQRPELRIPEMALLTEENWFVAARNAGFADDDAIRTALGDLRARAKANFAGLLLTALKDYADANSDLLPTDPAQLAPFFETPVDPAIFSRYEMRQKGKLSDFREGWLLAEKSSVDEVHDNRLFLYPSGWGSTSFSSPKP